MEDSLVEASLFGAHRRKIFGLWCNTATRHTAPILGGYYRTMYTVPLSAIGFGGVFQSLRLNHGVGRPSSIVGCKRQIDDFATCRQHSRVSHHFEHDICETRVHARASSATLHPSPNERHNSIEPASVSSEHTRRQSQSVLEASGLGSNPIILGFRRKIDWSVNLASLLAIGRSDSRSTQSYDAAIRRILRRRTRSVMESASSLDMKIRAEGAHGLISFSYWTAAACFATP